MNIGDVLTIDIPDYNESNPTMNDITSSIFTKDDIEKSIFGYTNSLGIRNTDRRKYIKLYLDGDNNDFVYKFNKMKRRERIIFMYICTKLYIDLDYVHINRGELRDYYEITPSEISRGIKQLLVWKIIFKSTVKDKYWINVNMICKGDTIKMWLRANDLPSYDPNSGIAKEVVLGYSKVMKYIIIQNKDTVHLTNKDMQYFCGIFRHHERIRKMLIKYEIIEPIDSMLNEYIVIKSDNMVEKNNKRYDNRNEMV